MATPDAIVIGGGISGLAYAWKTAHAGGSALVIEPSPRVGGCIQSHRTHDGFWFEMGAHTVYNSYGSLLDIAVGTAVTDKMVERGPARAQFGLLRGDQFTWLTPPKVLLQLSWLEAGLRFPFNVFRSKEGQTIGSYYSRLIGPNNFSRVLSPFLAAVPSQSADGFPVAGAGSLFKKRARRKEFMRSFGFEGGLSTLCDAVAAAKGVTVENGVAATRVARSGAGFAVTLSDGRTVEAGHVAVAAPPTAAAQMLKADFADVAAAIEKVQVVEVESAGVVLPKSACWMPECAFVVPVDDSFFSAVTRDPFPDANLRGFAFHFRGGTSRDAKLRRMAEVLRVDVADLGKVVERKLTLPRPALGHHTIVAAIDAALKGSALAVTGNYFAGLAIEDCILRSNAEFSRVAGAPL